MSKMSKRNIIASTIVGVLTLGSSHAISADPLVNLQKEEAKNHAEAAKSQKRINAVYEQTQDLLVEYRQVLDETENLKVYNDHIARLVADQQEGIDDLQRQIDGIEGVKRGVVPLMYKMVDSLEQFISLDVPINLEERKARVVRLRELMSNSNVSTSEQFRQVLESYQIELEYGSSIRAYQGELTYQGTAIAVDFFNLGRTALVALSLDQKNAWVWNNDSKGWDQLGGEYLGAVVESVKMARKIVPVNLIKMPIPAAE